MAKKNKEQSYDNCKIILILSLWGAQKVPTK